MPSMLSLLTCKPAHTLIPIKTAATDCHLLSLPSIESDVLSFFGGTYTSANVTPYIASNFTTQDYLIPYAQKKWQAGMPNCPI
jgi:hypothetical protein